MENKQFLYKFDCDCEEFGTPQIAYETNRVGAPYYVALGSLRSMMRQ